MKVARVVFLVSIIFLLIWFGATTNGLISGLTSSQQPENLQAKLEQDTVREHNITELDGRVVVASTQGIPPVGENGELVAFDKNGKIGYYESKYGMYFNIYPVQNKKYTIRYTASEVLYNNKCEGVVTDECTRSVYREVNMSTGENRTIYSEITPYVSPTRWHDVQNINKTHIMVASILHDGIFTVNTETGEKTWLWNASQMYERPEGKKLDWTHLNDADMVRDGEMIMLSLRNQDQVVFIEKQENGGYSVNETMTLGERDNYSILYEQHNPDYIQKKDGGPAVLVADSENNRIVEYQFENRTWERSMKWRDSRLQWPRDADRLPNGDTLVTDSNGERILMLSADGDVRWSVFIGLPYEAEVLGTGEGSMGPTSKLVWNPETEKGSLYYLLVESKDTLPRSLVNGMLFILPPWIHYPDLLLGLATVLVSALWVFSEVVYSLTSDS